MAAQLDRLGLAADRCGDVEIAATEAMNNVVEHAYAPCPSGEMRLALRRAGRDLVLVIRDRGQSLPGGVLPGGTAADLSGPVESLPEGGFGWFLIRQLTDRVSYAAAAGENRLCLRFGDVFPG